MKRILITALLAFTTLLSSAQGRRVSDMLEMPAYSKSVPEQVIFHKGYTVSFNSSHRIPNWSAWMLTKAHTDGDNERSGSEAFVEDPHIKKNCPNGRDYQYNTYKYDRGHMCPAMDNRWNATAMDECFYMSNMCPQKHELNGGSWKSLEEKCQKWARKYGKLYICCGPILSKGEKLQKIGTDKRITAPSRFFKVILRYDDKAKTAIGFIFEQDGKFKIMTVDEVEAITGLDFFHNLPDAQERKIESVLDTAFWADVPKNTAKKTTVASVKTTAKKSNSAKKQTVKEKSDYEKAQETIDLMKSLVDLIMK